MGFSSGLKIEGCTKTFILIHPLYTFETARQYSNKLMDSVPSKPTHTPTT